MTPALFISTSSLGKSAFTRAARAAICTGFATSLWIVWSFGYFAFTSSSTAWRRPVTMTSLPSSRNLSAKASPMPAEPPVMRMVRLLRFIRFLSYPASLFFDLVCSWDYVRNPNVAKKLSEADQKIISDAVQHSLPVGRLGQKARNRHSARNRAKNDKKVALPLTWGRTRHELGPAIRKLLHQVCSSFSNTQFGAGNLR